MRDHTKLRVFHLADQLVLSVYRLTQKYPRTEQFGLSSQMRRAAVSVASNIVEGCARNSQAEYRRFLEISQGSAHELQYQLHLGERLSLASPSDHEDPRALARHASIALWRLSQSLRSPR